jgi:hypothetical protein
MPRPRSRVCILSAEQGRTIPNRPASSHPRLLHTKKSCCAGAVTPRHACARVIPFHSNLPRSSYCGRRTATAFAAWSRPIIFGPSATLRGRFAAVEDAITKQTFSMCFLFAPHTLLSLFSLCGKSFLCFVFYSNWSVAQVQGCVTHPFFEGLARRKVHKI